MPRDVSLVLNNRVVGSACFSIAIQNQIERAHKESKTIAFVPVFSPAGKLVEFAVANPYGYKLDCPHCRGTGLVGGGIGEPPDQCDCDQIEPPWDSIEEVTK